MPIRDNPAEAGQVRAIPAGFLIAQLKEWTARALALLLLLQQGAGGEVAQGRFV